MSSYSLAPSLTSEVISPEVINIQRRDAELNIILLRVNNFDIKQKNTWNFVLLYATNTKEDLGR